MTATSRVGFDGFGRAVQITGNRCDRVVKLLAAMSLCLPPQRHARGAGSCGYPAQRKCVNKSDPVLAGTQACCALTDDSDRVFGVAYLISSIHRADVLDKLYYREKVPHSV